MQITIHDNQMNRVGFLSNEVPGLPSFFNDNWHRYLAEGASTFDFSVNKFKNGALQDYCQFLNDQAYISFTYEGEDFLFSVLTSEETDDVITLNCATLNLELRNEQANPLVNSASHNIQWYFDNMQLISTSQITIGINEVSNLTRTINYDGQESKLARLLSVIGNFDAEFEFVTDLNDDGTLKGISLNIYKANDGTSIQGVGTWRNDVTLYFGKNISGVRRTIDRTQIFNATTVTGSEGVNWNNSEWSVKNADGVEEFYKRKGSNTAFAPLSAELYPSQIKSSTGDFWIRKDFKTEYKSANEMWGYALSQFKKYAYALVTYEVSAKSKLVSQAIGDGQALSIGDTVRIQDKNFNAQTGGLILQARVSELEISFSNPSNNKLTFSNYVELESGISDDLEARLAQLIKDNTPYRAELTTTNGVQFKNGTGTTTLGAHIYFGSDTTETIADSYEWSKDGTVVANAQTITVDASGVTDKAVYSFKATIGGKVVASQSVTITNVNDGKGGADGKTSYTHVAWANSADGTDGFTTVYPNLNLLDGTKDFSGNWYNTSPWYKNGTYGKLTVMSFNTGDNIGIVKPFNIPSDGIYSMSMLVKVKTDSIGQFIIEATGKPAIIIDVTDTGGKFVTQSYTGTFTTGQTVSMYFRFKSSEMVIKDGLSVAGHKIELGSIATPYMPSSSEVTTADYPSYIGQYSDFTATASADPTKYAPWTVFKGNDGNNGRGIVSSEQKYQLTQTSAKPVDPWDNSVWQTTQPTTTSTNKYLWSITRTTFNLAPLTQDIVEQKAVYGDKGTDGDPGKVVSDTEPTTRFKGLTWKYLGTSDLTASDGTVIKPNTEYYYNGTNWMINYLSANNLEANSITADLIDAKNLTITDGEFVSTIINGSVQIQTEIKDDYLMIYKMDTSHNEIHTIALKSDSGLVMTYQNSDTGEYTSAGVNFQGLFMQNNITNEFARLTPRGTDLSTDVPWTNLTLASGFSIGSGGKARYRVKNGVLYIHFRKIVCPALSGNQPNTLCYVPANGRASDGYDSFGVMSATNSTRIQYNDSGDGKVAIVPASNTTSGQGFNGFLICPMD
nr:MAG TPA: tail protein [Caudoviricetes sp.]